MKMINFNTIIVFLTSFLIYKKFGGNIITFIPNLTIMIIIIFISLKNKLILTKSFFLTLLFFLLILIFSSLLWTDAPIYGLNKFINLLITVILFYTIFNTINNNYKLFYYSMFLFWIIYLINLYFEFGSFTNLLTSLDLRFRLGMELGEAINSLHPISISRYLGFQLLCLFIWIIVIRNFKTPYFSYLLIVPLLSISFIYLFFSGTKTPLLALILAISIFVLLSKRSKKIFSYIFLSLCFIIIAVYLSFDIKKTTLLTKEQKTYVEYRFFSSGKATSDRAYQNERALSKINENNFIFGAGTGNFAYLYNKRDTRDYPHNIFSEILYENGIIAMIFIFIMSFYAFYILRNSQHSLTIGYAMMYLYFLFNSLFSGDLISNNFVFGFWIFMILSYKNENKFKSLKGDL